jgi:hypothetical protein
MPNAALERLAYVTHHKDRSSASPLEVLVRCAVNENALGKIIS